jgi:hypothetical protein
VPDLPGGFQDGFCPQPMWTELWMRCGRQHSQLWTDLCTTKLLEITHRKPLRSPQ